MSLCTDSLVRLDDVETPFAEFRGRIGIARHLAANSSEGDADPRWVVYIERSAEERRLRSGWVHGDHAENVYDTIPVLASGLSPYEGEGGEGEPAMKRIRSSTDGTEGGRPPSVAVIVPYRDLHPEQSRAAQLAKFIPHMSRFLGGGGDSASWRIIVVEQSDDGRKFNRGKLLNIGFVLAADAGCDVFIFHDVDLLPSHSLLPAYLSRPARGSPVHVARVWGRYSGNADYVGGVAAWRYDDYRAINGFPNGYWGWGGEDDEMQRRCVAVWGEGFKMAAPAEGEFEDLEAMTIDEKVDHLREHRDWKCNIRWELKESSRTTWQADGVNNLSYTVQAQEPLPGCAAGGSAMKVTVDVRLNGTEWDAWAGTDADNKPQPAASAGTAARAAKGTKGAKGKA